QMNYILTEQHIYGSSRLGVDRRNVDVIVAGSPSVNVSLSVKRGEKHYELSNHLGNVLATVSDKKIAVMNGANLSYYRADVVSYSDYYPFGAPMTERTAVVTPTDVRYGFQGQEEDDELWNGAVSFKYRVEDARLGRFFSVDPMFDSFPWNGSYTFSENRLISNIELEGLEGVNIIDHQSQKTTLEIDLYYVDREREGNENIDEAFCDDQIEAIKNNINNELAKSTNYDFRYKKDDGTFYEVDYKINFIPVGSKEEASTNRKENEERSAVLVYESPEIRNNGGSIREAFTRRGFIAISSEYAGHTNVHEIFHLFVHWSANADPKVSFMGLGKDQTAFHKREGGIFEYGFPRKHVNEKNVLDALLHTVSITLNYPIQIPWSKLGF
ncbi:MAG: RHS repeat domain-containing protein, partial [Flavobacteriales bacterium]